MQTRPPGAASSKIQLNVSVAFLLHFSPNRNKSVTVTVPDAITEWRAGMFCTGPNGFGLAPTTSLLVFKPFLVDLALPSSVIQGETFILKATVFNYLQRCMKVGEP